jgi:hypothetical protein
VGLTAVIFCSLSVVSLKKRDAIKHVVESHNIDLKGANTDAVKL